MANLQTFDISAHLQDLETVAAYLDACLEEGGQELFLAGLGHVMKSHGMSDIVARAGLGSRSSAYRAFSSSGNPELASVGSVLDSLDLRLSVVPKEHSEVA
ncbi:addiction module antidote protein [Xanthomonas citri pv. glycines]|uniref:Addiction module antidote protein n=1 Tax=Xanthomonas citri pv. vignicola TaxID=473426 RepID=A0AB33CU39_XANCI|nr:MULTISPECIES: addiction module antidote protein [Xanthomonas]MBV6783596.1 putative addiction module antidote protein [Xanthomonas campestris pv. trichodesmae]ASK94301.1 putative addiction module antidote protein [Xanthomonas citri pv. vignicola]AZB52705.1 putative addiction module antidote protein [Xanthomonas citri pv. glycines str. 8ra]MBV6898214.1 putative addiction module antidote protein [Xanthomonas campestris pv. ionidii]QDR46410.1 putative addiction module antidote protein [Xanthomo